MPVVIEQDLLTQRVKIYVYQDDPKGVRIFTEQVGPGQYRDFKPDEGGIIPPFMELPSFLFRELVREIKHVKEPSEATQAHLDDAIVVRDRLLKLVERG